MRLYFAALSLYPLGCLAGTSIYATCQSTSKLTSSNPLSGCPSGTVFVSQTSSHANYTTVQAAVKSLPLDSSTRYILIDQGSYKEQVNVTRKGPTYLLGATDNPQNYTGNTVTVWWAQVVSSGQDDSVTSTLTIAPDFNGAAIGSGYYGFSSIAVAGKTTGSTDFRSYNINFQNKYSTSSDGPSLALDCSYSNCGFYGTQFASYQDTVYVGHNGSAYFSKSEVLGQTDYIFGFGTAWFNNSFIGNRACGGGITAWKGTPNYTNTYGAYFWESQIVKSPDASSSTNLTHKCALGRPWNNESRVIYMNCYMDSTILPAGFIEWSSSTPQLPPYGNYAEYNSSGPGWSASGRNTSIEQLLTNNPYSLNSVFGGIPSWIDLAY